MRGRHVLLLVLALVGLWASPASADMCFGGGGRPPRPDPTPQEKKDGEPAKDAEPRQASLAAGLALSLAFVGFGLYFFRRRERFLGPCLLFVVLGVLVLTLGKLAVRAKETPLQAAAQRE